jgi:hypothetical protein
MHSNGKRLPSIWFCVDCNIQYHDSIQACKKCNKTRYENIRFVRQKFADQYAQQVRQANLKQFEKYLHQHKQDTKPKDPEEKKEE